MSLTPKNWAQFQHYKNRRPAWIKLHHALLDDYDFTCLPVASRALAPCLWLLASEYENGEITASLDEISFRVHLSKGELTSALIPLIEKGFILDASNMLADRYQDASLEKRREREEKNKMSGIRQTGYSKEFEQFWVAYPRTPVMAKKEAGAAWKRLSEADQQAAITALPAYKSFLASKPDHAVVHACRFLSQRRFDGFAAQPKPQNGGGWRPGLPTSEELKAKYAQQIDRRDDPEPTSVVADGTKSRPH